MVPTPNLQSFNSMTQVSQIPYKPERSIANFEQFLCTTAEILILNPINTKSYLDSMVKYRLQPVPC